MDLGLGFSTALLFRPTIRRIRNRTLLQIFTPGIIARIDQNCDLLPGALLRQETTAQSSVTSSHPRAWLLVSRSAYDLPGYL
jgi:hypothetical protein